MSTTKLSCFKAYDIRGKVPQELDEALAFKIGRAYASEFQPKNIVVGQDIRLESPRLAKALIKGITESGAEVFDLGLCGTEEVYFQTAHLHTDGGIMITASHNPKGYNGMKLVSKDAKPIANNSGLQQLKLRIQENRYTELSTPAKVINHHNKSEYIKQLLSYIDTHKLKPLKIVMDPGNGAAGEIIKQLQKHLPFECILINEKPDGNFPNGVPNPLLHEKRSITAAAVKYHKADLGIAWDGDFDRCFLFDENGDFIEGYYLISLIAQSLLQHHPGEKIIYDSRLNWNTIEQVSKAGGTPIESKTGHAFIKQKLRQENAIYGGEMSAHHYFRDFFYCDSGMIPWLLVTQLLSQVEEPLSQLIKQDKQAYPCSGELNYLVNDAKLASQAVQAFYEQQNPKINMLDGLTMEFTDWRLNLRSSNTEPYLRLNIETRANNPLLQKKILEVEAIIKQFQ